MQPRWFGWARDKVCCSWRVVGAGHVVGEVLNAAKVVWLG
jgi:hypothetical protein